MENHYTLKEAIFLHKSHNLQRYRLGTDLHNQPNKHKFNIAADLRTVNLETNFQFFFIVKQWRTGVQRSRVVMVLLFFSENENSNFTNVTERNLKKNCLCQVQSMIWVYD